VSGLLRRLAVHALGLAAPVRSSARLPYAAAPALEVESRELAPPAEAPALETPAPVATRLTPLAPLVAAPPESAAGSPAESSPAMHVGARAVHGEPAGPGATRPGRGSSRPIAPEPVSVPRRRQVPQAPRGTFEPGSSRLREETDAEAIQEAVPSALRRALPENPAPPPTLLPLSPRRAVAPGVVSAAPGSPAGAAGQGPADETREIHVSIGRIEVTAVHEAPAPKRRAARTRKPTTLDEYLAQRRGEHA